MKYKTETNLKEIQQQLDDACGLIDNATIDLNQIANLPSTVSTNLDCLDLSRVVSLKNAIESLIELDNKL